MHLLHNSKAVVHEAAALTARAVKAAARKRPLLWPTWQTLPVAGLDVPVAQSVLYSLRKTLAGDEEATAVIQAWLHALQLAQVASDRLLHSISIVQKHLRFWQARLKAGSHTSFLLLGTGPVSFAADVLEHFGLRQRQQSSGMSASDRIEERIVALQMLSTQLAEALSAVHRAASSLKLAQSAHEQHQVLSAVAACAQACSEALEQLQSAAAELQEQEDAVRYLSAAAYQASVSHLPQRQGSTQKQQQQQYYYVEEVQQQLEGLGQLLHVEGDTLTHMHSADAGAALGTAASIAATLGPLVAVPQWAAMPSSLQRHWIKYTLAAGVGVYAGVFLYRNSRLSGSPNLDTWVKSGAEALEGAWSNHVVSPLVMVRDELFKTFRDRPSIVSTAEFEADKASLLRMLADFQADHPHAAAALAALGAADSSSSSSSSSSSVLDGQADVMNIDAVNKGMQVVMQCYESDVKKPIRGLLQGELARTLLIQVQRLKLDTEAAMLELDQILRANELSISLVAAVPGLLLSWTLLRGLWVLLLVRAPPDARREATPCRLAMAELERALATLDALKYPPPPPPARRPAAAAAGAAAAGSAVNTPSAAPSASVAAAEGMVLYKLFKVYREAQALYRLKDSSSRYSDWPQMADDLLSMVDLAQGPAAKLDLHRRMLRTYYVLQP